MARTRRRTQQLFVSITLNHHNPRQQRVSHLLLGNATRDDTAFM